MALFCQSTYSWCVSVWGLMGLSPCWSTGQKKKITFPKLGYQQPKREIFVMVIWIFRLKKNNENDCLTQLRDPSFTNFSLNPDTCYRCKGSSDDDCNSQGNSVSNCGTSEVRSVMFKAVRRNFFPGGARLSTIEGESKRGREAPERGESVGGGCPPSHTRELLHIWDWNWTIWCTL